MALFDSFTRLHLVG